MLPMQISKIRIILMSNRVFVARASELVQHIPRNWNRLNIPRIANC